jgi:hypothetical protein
MRREIAPSGRGVEELQFSPCNSAESSRPSGTQASSRAAQQGLWDANGSLGMLNGAFLLPQRGKMRGERNFSFEVSLGEGQPMVV